MSKPLPDATTTIRIPFASPLAQILVKNTDEIIRMRYNVLINDKAHVLTMVRVESDLMLILTRVEQ